MVGAGLYRKGLSCSEGKLVLIFDVPYVCNLYRPFIYINIVFVMWVYGRERNMLTGTMFRNSPFSILKHTSCGSFARHRGFSLRLLSDYGWLIAAQVSVLCSPSSNGCLGMGYQVLS